MRHARKDYDRFQDPALDDPSLLSEGSTPIHEYEPVMIFRAQDKHAAAVVAYYAMRLAKDPDVNSEMASTVLHWSIVMREWAAVHGKSPDMPLD